MVRIPAFESNFAIAASEIEGLLVIELESRTAYFDDAGTADIEDAQLATGQETGRFQRVDGLQFQFFVHRHGTADDHAVVHRIDHVHFIGREYFPDQEVAAQTGRVVMFGILGMRGIADFVIGFHI